MRDLNVKVNVVSVAVAYIVIELDDCDNEHRHGVYDPRCDANYCCKLFFSADLFSRHVAALRWWICKDEHQRETEMVHLEGHELNQRVDHISLN